MSGDQIKTAGRRVSFVGFRAEPRIPCLSASTQRTREEHLPVSKQRSGSRTIRSTYDQLWASAKAYWVAAVASQPTISSTPGTRPADFTTP